MSVLGRSELERSPLADLHMIASELGIDSYRRLRKADLIAAILERQGGEEDERGGGDETSVEAPRPRAQPRRRARGGRRSRGPARDADPGDERADESSKEEAVGRRGARSERSRPPPARSRPSRSVEGVVEVLSGGSGFVRVSPPEPSEEDVYVSAAQVRRCDLVSGDTVTGPVRAPRRSERHPVADPHRHDQRCPGRRGGGGDAVRRASGRLPAASASRWGARIPPSRRSSGSRRSAAARG